MLERVGGCSVEVEAVPACEVEAAAFSGVWEVEAVAAACGDGGGGRVPALFVLFDRFLRTIMACRACWA